MSQYAACRYRFSSQQPSGSSAGSGTGSSCGNGSTGSCSSDSSGTSSTGSGLDLPYPGFAPVVMRYLSQDSRPRSWCLMLITNPWFERISMLVILLNCVTLGMYQPCVDENCVTNRCKILQIFDDFIFAFFSLEMTIKMIAMGVHGRGTYLADSWNRLDFFIVLAGALEYCLHVENMNLSAIRTIRVLRPLRAINRIPSMRILVMLLLDTLPMLGNVLLLCFFVFFIFGIVGVQLWEGILRQRCVLQLPPHVNGPKDLPEEYTIRVRINSISFYYEISKEQEYICSRPEDSGMHHCAGLPHYRIGAQECNATALPYSHNLPTNTSCVDWHRYYTNCTQLGGNPFQGTISFDNIGLAWVAIFLVISLEGWTDIMYYVQDAHSFWDWIYFVLLIVIGSFFMINLCLVVIATQFSETKKREMARMRQERARFNSTSTLASSTNNSEPATCYAEIVKYVAHLYRRSKRRLLKKIRLYKYRRQQLKEQSLISKSSDMAAPARHHHPHCPRSHQSLAPHGPSGSPQPLQSGAGGLNNAPSSPDTSLTEQTPPLLLATQTHVLLGPAGSVGSLRPALLRVPSAATVDGDNQSTGLLSPPPSVTSRRRSGSSSVAFSDVVLLHHSAAPPLGSSITPLSAPLVVQPAPNTNICSSEKTTQTGDGNIWQVTLPNQSASGLQGSALSPTLECSELCLGEAAMTCQELLALSGALSAALPTGQIALDSFFNSLSKGVQKPEEASVFPAASQTLDLELEYPASLPEYPACCCEVQITTISGSRSSDRCEPRSVRAFCAVYRVLRKICGRLRGYVKRLVEYKYFQQGILLAILINTLSMGIEYHNQPEELTVIVEYSNVVFSAIFAVEMMLKVIAEGPFGYIANGFNVFDGVIVVLSVIELCQTFLGERGGSSGLSVLRTFRLLRILKLVRFMPNLRRQLFVMLRTMDNVAVFFSLLVLFIFIFSVLGMYLFGGKFCRFTGDPGEGVREITSKGEIVERECTCPEIVSRDPRCECDRKHFNDILWATVTVFQILTQEDWNVVLFNGMEKTSHWAALYFVALMTFGNYVLFNLLVAILVEGFSSERNERREREQRELAKSKLSAECYSDEGSFDESRTAEDSSSDSFTQEIKNTWRSADELHKLKDSNGGGPNAKQLSHLSHKLDNKRQNAHLKRQQEPKCNIEKQSKMLQRRDIETSRSPLPVITHTAATPQDSPNTTLEAQSHVSGSVRARALGLGDAALLDSLDFFDRTSSSSIPGLLKPPCARASSSNTLKASCIIAVPPFEKSNHEKASSNINTGQIMSHVTSDLSKNGLNASNNGLNSAKNDSEKINNDLIYSNELSIRTNGLSASNNVLYPSTNASESNGALVSSNHSLNISNTGLNSSNNESSSVSNGFNSKHNDLLVCNSDPFANSCSNLNNNGLQANHNGSPNINISPQQNNGNNGAILNNNGQAEGHNITIAMPYCDKNTNMKDNLNNGSVNKSGSALKIQRGYSWKLSRASLRRKNSKNTRSASETDAIVVLNNGRHHAQCRNADLQSVYRIQNDTHGALVTSEQSSNNSRLLGVSTSPAPSFRGRSSTFGSIPQAGWALGLNFPTQNSRKHSVSSVASNNQKMHHRARRRSCAPEHFLTQISPEDLIVARSRKSINSCSNILLANLAEQLELPKNISEENMNSAQTPCPPSSNNLEAPQQTPPTLNEVERSSKLKELVKYLEPTGCLKGRDDYSLYVFPTDNKFRLMCCWFVEQKWFDNLVLLFIAMNCITLAMERPNIPPSSTERLFLATANYIFTAVFAVEMFVKVVAAGMIYGEEAYFTSGWNIMDGSLVIISIIDLLMSLVSESSPRIFGILRVFRLLRSLRPLRVINRAPGLKLVVQTLLSSLRPIGNIVLICCTFFIIFGILGVQLFKGAFYYCEGENIKGVKNKTDCLAIEGNVWINRKYNFDDLGKALMSLFVLSSRDGWVNIMYTGLDAVGVDQQPIVNYSEWRLLYFIAFILLVGFFVLNMFVGVVVENFHRCREEQEKEERVRRAAKRALQMEKKRRLMHQPPYYIGYSPTRMLIHKLVTSKYFDLAIAAVIGLNVVTMATEYYKMPVVLEYALKVFNYFFTAVFIIEAGMKLVALGLKIYLKDKWNQLDVAIVILSVVGIVLEELETNIIPINPTIIRVMRVLRIARVLKLLKMAKGIRALLDTVMQALPQVGNLGLLFFLLFFIFAALGVELFGRLECSDEKPCQGLGEHAHFANFGMAFLTLFRVATGDNWNGIMKDTLREDCDDAADCVRNCCVSTIIAPIFFVIFVLMAQFVLVNVVVAVLMKHLEESHKQMEDEQNMETELEREMEREMEDVEDKALCKKLEENGDKVESRVVKRPLTKVLSLPKNYTYSPQVLKQPSVPTLVSRRRMSMMPTARTFRRQTFHSHQALGLPSASKNPSLALETCRSAQRNRSLLETTRNPSLAETSRTFSLLETTRRPSVLETFRNPSLREISRAASLAETCRRHKYSTETDPDEVLYEEDGLVDDLQEGRRRNIVLKLNQDASGILRKRLEKARSYEEPCVTNGQQTQMLAEMQLFRESYVGDFLTVPSNNASLGRRPQMLQRQVSISSHYQDQLIEEPIQESSLLLSVEDISAAPKREQREPAEERDEEFQESCLLLPETKQSSSRALELAPESVTAMDAEDLSNGNHGSKDPV